MKLSAVIYANCSISWRIGGAKGRPILHLQEARAPSPDFYYAQEPSSRRPGGRYREGDVKIRGGYSLGAEIFWPGDGHYYIRRLGANP
jgi:hypothetical protein